MADQNIGLKDAYQLISDSPELTGEATNWNVVADRYRSFRVDSGTVSESNYNTNEAYRIKRAVDLITARAGAAHDAGALLRLYTETAPQQGRARVIRPETQPAGYLPLPAFCGEAMRRRQALAAS